MKEFIFYLGPSEVRQFANRLLSRGCVLIPKKPFPIGPYPRVSGCLPDEPVENIFSNLSALVFGPFSVHEPVIRTLPEGKLARVSHNQGGPMFELHLPGWWLMEGGVLETTPGKISMQSEFWDTALSQRIGPTPESKKYYSGLVNELKRELVRIDKYWIGVEVIKLIKNSNLLIRPAAVGEQLLRALSSK
jgi:hypothetical protein